MATTNDPNAYFTPEHFDLLTRWQGQEKTREPESVRAYDELAKAYVVTQAWAEGVKRTVSLS